jgi:hypothetical protein
MPDINKPQITAELSIPTVDNHDAEMARADLYKMAKYSMKLFQMIQEGQELESWVQAKITKASDYVSSIYHYMEYQQKFGAGGDVTNLEDLTGEATVNPTEEAIDDEAKMKEGLSYEERLRALLEGKVKQARKVKETAKQKGVDGKACWDGYKRMGTKKKGGKTVDNCVPTGKKK